MNSYSGNEVSDSYFSRVGKVSGDKQLRREEEKELMKRVENGDKEARQQMVHMNLKLVIWVAKKFSGKAKKLEFMDLIQAGNIGLLEAVGKFDWRKGTKFSSYATFWIEQKIGREIYNYDRTIRLPVHKCEQMSRFSKTFQDLAEKNGKEPTMEEVASEMNISEEEAIELKNILFRSISLNKEVSNESGSEELGYFLEDERENPEEEACENLSMDEFGEIFKTLKEREEFVLLRRFGIFDGRKRTLEEIGKIMRLTRERVRQIESEALEKLRNQGGIIKEYIEELTE